MAPTDSLKALVDQMPDPDPKGLYSVIDKAQVETAAAAIHAGGRDSILGLIDLLVEPGQGDDFKAHYALHCIALRVCQLGDARARADFARTLASQVGGRRPKGVQKYLVQEIQACGGREVVETLGTLLTDEDLCDEAARALVSIRDGAVEPFRAALAKARGKCRLAVVQNLGALADAASVPALRQALDDPDREVRLAAAWGLASIGDAASADLLVKAADKADGWERTQLTKACLLLAERLAAAGPQAAAQRT
jgi:HEAT repeat protein